MTWSPGGFISAERRCRNQIKGSSRDAEVARPPIEGAWGSTVKRVEREIPHTEPERYNRVIEKMGSMVEEDSSTQGVRAEKSPDGTQTTPSAPVFKNRRGQEETYQEGGSSSSGSGNQTRGDAQEPLGAPPDVEMEEIPGSIPTKHRNNNNTAGKRSRDSEEEGRASNAIRTYSQLKERSRRPGGEALDKEPNRKILRAHGESRGEVSWPSRWGGVAN